jgi:hypothetical protein
MPTTVKIRRSGTASATPSALEHGEIAINYADGKVFWKNASNVITSFTFQSYALASHTHSISDVTGLQTALDGKASSSHTHGNISNAGAIGSTADQFVVTTTSGVLTAVSAATARTTLSVQPTASPTFTGTLTAATCSFSGTVTVTSPLVITGTVAGNVRQLRMQTSGSTRWEVGPGFDAESGSNVGSTFWVTRWSDSGVFLGTPIAIARATGVVTLENQLLVSAGSKSTCSVAPSGDPDTGMFFPLANTLALSTGDVERVRVDSSGNVGIGASPGTTLDIQRASSDAAVFVQGQTSGTGATLQMYSGSGLGYVGTRNNYPLLITSNNSERMRVKTTGSVRFVPLSADPSTGNEAGDVYYNSTTNKLRVYNGTSWVDLH